MTGFCMMTTLAFNELSELINFQKEQKLTSGCPVKGLILEEKIGEDP